MSIVDPKPLVQPRNGKAVLISERGGPADSAPQSDLELTTTLRYIHPGEEWATGFERRCGPSQIHRSRDLLDFFGPRDKATGQSEALGGVVYRLLLIPNVNSFYEPVGHVDTDGEKEKGMPSAVVIRPSSARLPVRHWIQSL